MESIIERTSLSATLDNIAAAFFENRRLTAGQRLGAARWIAARQGLPGAYGDTFAAFPAERSRGIVVFTGERFTSASARHIVGEEACRALELLDVRDASVAAALRKASAGLLACFEREAKRGRQSNPGTYCCGKCTVGLWRHLLAGGLDRREERLERGVGHLRRLRKGDGTWRRFPFWYTVLALAEMDTGVAKGELRYAAPALERAALRAPGFTKYARRRHELARRTLGA